jgi:hypothetical protein
MYELDGRTGDRRAFDVRAGKLACGECEQRANALAGAEHGVTHRRMQPRRDDPERRKHLLQNGFNTALPGRGPALEIGGIQWGAR